MGISGLGLLLAVCIGISLGLMGGGGSILAVPVLVYVVGVDPKAAISMSLAIVGLVSLIGAAPHWRQGHVNLSAALAFTPAAMAGAYLGARLTALPWITEDVQLGGFALVMVAASLFMIRRTPPALVATAPPRSRLWLGGVGLAVGVLTGFVGVGGGFLIVPALILGGTAMKEAVGTSLLIITANSVAGLLGYVGQVSWDVGLTVSFILAASLGTLIGAHLTQRLDARQLQKAFGYFVLAIAVFVLVQQQVP